MPIHTQLQNIFRPATLKSLLKRLANRSLSLGGLGLSPPLPLPQDITEQQLFDFVTSVRVENGPEEEMRAYGIHDFRRFVFTWGMAQNIQGKCLELGANPYFTTLLLKKFTSLELSLANYFGSMTNTEYQQSVEYTDMMTGQRHSESLNYQHFNIEDNTFPYPDNSFDVIVFAEIIEHLLNDPCKVLREIKRVLTPEGLLILTTPNVSRLENVARMIAGENIYDPYSGYGPYGRHNREYNRHELNQLLTHEGFQIETAFTADVHANHATHYCDISKLRPLLTFRETDLGQYIFIKAKLKQKETATTRPRWLYRSYPEADLG